MIYMSFKKSRLKMNVFKTESSSLRTCFQVPPGRICIRFANFPRRNLLSFDSDGAAPVRIRSNFSFGLWIEFDDVG